MRIAKMRTVRQCVAYFKDQDPETCINEYYLRGIIKRGEIPVVYAGVKQLVNLDILIRFLNFEDIEQD